MRRGGPVFVRQPGHEKGQQRDERYNPGNARSGRVNDWRGRESNELGIRPDQRHYRNTLMFEGTNFVTQEDFQQGSRL